MTLGANGRMDDELKMKSDEIDVEALIKKVKENMDAKKRRQNNEIINDSKSDIKAGTTKGPAIVADELASDICYLNNNWKIENNSYVISSHRQLVGPVLVKGRKLVNGEIRRYVDPMLWAQSEFNASLVRVIGGSITNIDERLRDIDNHNSDIDTRIRDIDNRINDVNVSLDGKIEDIKKKCIDSVNITSSQLEKRIDDLKKEAVNRIDAIDNKLEIAKSEISVMTSEKVREMVLALDTDINNKAWLANVLKDRIEHNHIKEIASTSHADGSDINYFVFEERFRGSTQDIKQRQTAFISYYRGCNNVLDIGCGRGEFLELMRENGIGAHGIDVDGDMIDYCINKGLDVKKVDALAYLEGVEDKSLDGIFIDQVVEHLEPQYLVKMLKLCYQKLKYGYYLFIETVNPVSLTSFANFYIDMTHKQPIHPATLRFLFESAGFMEIEVKFVGPVDDGIKLKKVDIDQSFDEKEKKVLAVYNDNIDRLNNILYGPQDYAVIGKK